MIERIISRALSVSLSIVLTSSILYLSRLPALDLPFIAAFIQIDPTPYTAWGVLGALVFVLIVFAGVGWKLFGSISSSFDTRDKTLIDFVNLHRGETTLAMKEVAHCVNESNRDIASALREQSRVLDQMMLTDRVTEQLKRRRGESLPTREELESIVRQVIRESRERGDSTRA